MCEHLLKQYSAGKLRYGALYCWTCLARFMGEFRPQLIGIVLQRVVFNHFTLKLLWLVTFTGTGHKVPPTSEVINESEETIPPIVRTELDLSPLIESTHSLIPERPYPATVRDRVQKLTPPRNATHTRAFQSQEGTQPKVRPDLMSRYEVCVIRSERSTTG
ncbi:hypothetical protein P167DRAFT_579857 [Morchella conica CCBAS932]|uniref:Uncharacterized protein n=1 Tax=Morchella conica CCBAS932 TaxID=1392247 RepID=A0A3N4KMA0_9PEZI|nr:hypothetical protein P167DRAFT_579857 [Morchella conica CCBAS932]